MLVSIITPTYNSAEFLIETYQSILEQTYQNWEWLITDDCSSDATWTLLENIAKEDCRIKVARNEVNSGAAVTRNNSIARATGEFLAFLDSDDTWYPTKLEEHIAFMNNNDSSISFTPYELIDEQSNDIGVTVDKSLSGSFDYEDMLRKRATMGCCTVIVRTFDFDNVSMPLIRAGQDYALWLKLLRTGKTADIFPKVLSKYRLVGNSLSANKKNKAIKTWLIYRSIEKLNLVKAAYVFCHYAFRAYFGVNQQKVDKQ